MTLDSVKNQSSNAISSPKPTIPLEPAKSRGGPVRVVINLTDSSIVEGFIHLQPHSRSLDLLNQGGATFLAVTDARVSKLGIAVGDLPFLAVSKAQIVDLYEAEES